MTVGIRAGSKPVMMAIRARGDGVQSQSGWLPEPRDGCQSQEMAAIAKEFAMLGRGRLQQGVQRIELPPIDT